MTAKNLSTVAVDLIDSYANTAKHVIDAYAAGGERLVFAMEQRWNSALKQSRSELTAEVARNASAAQAAFSGYYIRGLDLTTTGAQHVVNQVVKVMEIGVERAASNASLFEEKTGMTALNTLAAVTAPGALALSKLAAKVEQKTAGLAGKIAGADAEKASAKRTSAFSQRRAATAA